MILHWMHYLKKVKKKKHYLGNSVWGLPRGSRAVWCYLFDRITLYMLLNNILHQIFREENVEKMSCYLDAPRNAYLLTLLLGLREPLHWSYIFTLWQSTRVIAVKPLASLDVTMSVSESCLWRLKIQPLFVVQNGSRVGLPHRKGFNPGYRSAPVAFRSVPQVAHIPVSLSPLFVKT
jgi:hypothetical protein